MVSRARGYQLLLAAFLAPLLVLVRTGHADGPGGEPAELAAYDALVQPPDRAHWSFLPLGRPAVPAVRDNAWARNPIDCFVLARLEERGWHPSPPAEPRAILRRMYLDLIGLPPTLEEQEAFLRDATPQALDRVVQELLARPAYGERWARHWLDVVRYAETNGYERDATKPHAWRFRDYVIRALNNDKPFDRFVLEQLAGDELPDADAETVIATGLHRLGPWDDEPADPKQDRFDQLDDIVSTTSQVFLGLTLGCARCHNHKFDPLTMLDYYRMVAIFRPLERPQQGRTELDLSLGTRDQLEAIARRDRAIAELDRQIDERRASFRIAYLDAGQSRLPPEALAAFLRAPAERDARQKALVEQHARSLDDEAEPTLPDDAKGKLAELRFSIDELRRATPDLPRGYFLREPAGEAAATQLLRRGSAASPGPHVEPGVPAVLVARQPAFPPPGPQSSLRRLTLARWIARPDNPLTPRVIVNRVWQFHFGEGLVRTANDFGRMGDAPSHPELLDWLARWFVEHGASLKQLHTLILSSNTYRMSKGWNAEYGAADPEDRLLWRVPYRRLEVEAIRDAMLAVSGQLNTAMYGPSMYPQVPKEALDGHSDPDKIWPPFEERAASRRTVYAFVKRSMVVPLLEVLDLCDTTRSSAKRSVTTVAPQALALFNGDFVNRQAAHLAGRLVREAGRDPDAEIDRLYRLALCRPPTATEQAGMRAFLEREAADLREESARSSDPTPQDTAARRALEQLCRAVLNLNEFVYPD